MNATLTAESEQVADANKHLVEAEAVSVVFGMQSILQDINLTIRRGQTVAIIGESGCGKTVFMKTLVGLIRPSAGQVSFDGRRLGDMGQDELTRTRRQIRLRVSKRGVV